MDWLYCLVCRNKRTLALRVAGATLLLVFALSSGWSVAHAQEESDMATDVLTIIHADVFLTNANGCPVELYVNDIPVARAGGTLQRFASVPVPEFLVSGENTLSLVIGNGPTPATAKGGAGCEWGVTAAPEMEAVARITRLQEGMMAGPKDGETLIELHWTGDQKDSLPVVASITANLGEQPSEWAWESATPLTLDDATRKSAVEFIDRLRVAYEHGKVDDFLTAITGKLKEFERAYPVYGEGMMVEMFGEELRTMSSMPEWKPRNLPHDDYDLRLVANGRMIEAVAKDWRPIIRMANDDYGYQLFIGQANGEWRVLR